MVPKDLLMTDSKAANDARAVARARFGLGKDYKFIKPSRLTFEDYQIQDPNYLREQLQDNKLSWEEL